MKTKPSRTATHGDTNLTDGHLAADQAWSAYQWDAAVDLYTQALEQADISAVMEYELRSSRAICHRYLGDYTREAADLEEMGQLAEALGDLKRQVSVLNRQARVLMGTGDLVGSKELAEAALARAWEPEKAAWM
jgi:tetratricopeptide (TPR) repeat protein